SIRKAWSVERKSRSREPGAVSVQTRWSLLCSRRLGIPCFPLQGPCSPLHALCSALVHLDEFLEFAGEGGACFFRGGVAGNGDFEEALSIVAAASESSRDATGSVETAIGQDGTAGGIFVDAVKDVKKTTFGFECVLVESDGKGGRWGGKRGAGSGERGVGRS